MIHPFNSEFCLYFQYVNHAFERLTGYNSEEVLGKNSTEIVKNEKNRPDLNDTITSQLKKGKVNSLRQHFYC